MIGAVVRQADRQYTTQLSVDATPQLVQPHPGDPNNLVSWPGLTRRKADI